MTRGPVWCAAVVVLGGVSAVAPAWAQTVRVLPLRASAIVAEPVSGRIYAAVPADAGAAGNSVVSLDPVTGEVGAPVFVGSDPAVLAASEDGQHLYVGFNGATAIRRFDVSAGAAGPLYPLARIGPFDDAEFARVILPVPGSPGTLVVGQSMRSLSHFSLAVYDNGVLRPDRPTDLFESVVMVDATTLVASSSAVTTRLRLGPTGLTTVSSTWTPGGPKLVGSGAGQVYGEDGTIFDAATMAERRRVPLRTAFPRPQPLPVPAQGRFFRLDAGNVTTFDLTTTDILSVTALPLDAGEPRSLVALGAGLAYYTTRPSVVLVGDFAAPSPTPVPAPGPSVQVDLVGCTACRPGDGFHAVATLVNPAATAVRVEVKAHLLGYNSTFNLSPFGGRHAVVDLRPGTQSLTLLQGIVPPGAFGPLRIEMSLSDPATGRRLSVSSRAFQIN